MQPNEVSISLLKPHPKNAEYFSPPSDEEKEVLRRSIACEGIRDPLKVTQDYVVVAGHVRLEVAKELGLKKVPVQIVDGDPEYLEYLLIADNDERRICNDPIKKAKRAEFLRRYWGVREGSANPKGTIVPRQDQNGPDDNRKTLADIAETIGESKTNLKRLLKLNDLIPEFQELVSSGELGSTAAYELAFLSPDTQKQLLSVYGEKIAGLRQAEAKELRRKIEAEIRAEAKKQVAELEQKIDELNRRQRELQVLHEQREADLKKAVADLQERLESASPEKAARLQEELQKKEQELAEARERLATAEAGYKAEITALRKKIEELEAKKPLQPEVVEKIVERVVEVPDPKQQIRIKELEEQIAALQEKLKDSISAGKTREALLDEIKKLEAEKKVLEREVNRLRSPSLFASKMRRLVLVLEKEEAEMQELAHQVDISESHLIEAQKWIGTLDRYKEIIRTALGAVGRGRVIDLTPVREGKK